MQVAHHFIRQILTLLALLLTLAVFFGWLLLDRLPQPVNSHAMDALAVKHSQQLLTNLNHSIRHAEGQQWTFVANTDELNSAFAMASRTLPGFQGAAEVVSDQWVTLLTLPVTVLGSTYFLNAKIEIRPSEGPLDIQVVRLGMLRLPGDTALAVIGWLADQAWGAGQGAELLSMVRKVHFQQNQLKVELDKPAGWDFQRLKQSGFTVYRELFSSPKRRADIEFYYAVALQHAETAPNASLVVYLQLLFRQAALRTAIYPDELDRAQQENQAVLLALAQLLGGHHLQLLVNEVKSPPGGKVPKVTLARRTDLQQHFIYSAAIHILANQNISHTVGEAKELLDSVRGGSGFSFVDLLADRAGIRFAQLAVGDPLSAKQLQQFFQQDVVESDIFPSKTRLPEGISQQDFETHYQSLNSENYRNMVAEIDRRLNALPLYRRSP